ncbi:MAG: WD40/YVTN/BNR-like repeat-containing protein [Gemmatimonadaceae bacterium]
MRPSPTRAISSIPIGVAPALVLLLSASALEAQAKSTTVQFKGILEPVSYTEDLPLRDVFFVTVDVGWVAGDGGTILRTTDGGAKWEAQLGGDPGDRADPVRVLHFLDERRGWAMQGEAGGSWKTLHTRDGESWEEIGSAPYGVDDIAFTSPQTGFAAGNPGMAVNGPNVMFRTSDGGRTWEPVWTCEAKVAMGGLNQNLDCVIGQIRFPTPEVGYAVARRSSCVGCGPPPLIAKTTDGGQTWALLPGPGVTEEDAVSAIFFLDELTGFARLDSKKLHMTTDGGKTWRGIVASPGEALRFADPTVGWGVELGRTDFRWSYTTDGGKRWTSREVRLPAVTRGFSLPRRDRAYVVGDHGMIFRYRVVPASHSLGPNDIAMPAMPAFESALDEQVKELEQVVTELGSSLSAAGGAQGGAAAADAVAGAVATDPAGAGAAGGSAATAGEPLNAPLPPASQFTAQCCKKSFSRLEVILGALSQTLPEFIGKYKNLNLLLAAVRMGAELPGEYRAVKGGLKAFRQAKDKESATAALAGVSTALSALKQTTAVSMQQQLPPPPSGGAGGGGDG